MDDILTLERLKAMKPGIFASGTIIDGPEGINIANTGKVLRWVASRGTIHDWAIYCQLEDWSEQRVLDYGDKVHSEMNIKKLVKCDDEAFQVYRY